MHLLLDRTALQENIIESKMAPNLDDYNEDELDAPEWLNNDVFTIALQNLENDKTNIKLKSLKLAPGSNKGDHYASVMFRATVEYEYRGNEKTKSMIVKTMPEIDGQKKDLLEETHIFETEIGMYMEVIPRFEQILRSIGDKTEFGAKCIHYGLKPKKFVIFEDIVPLGYTVIRKRFLQVDEIKAVYTKLAKWHAISYKLSHEEPQFLEKYRYGFMTMKNMIDSEFVTTGIDNFICVLEAEPTLTKYKPYFESIKPDLIKKCKEMCAEYVENRQDDSIYVLCHGDFHGKNMMFKHNSETGKMEDVILLDFQIAFMGPIVYDLVYSRFMLMDPDTRADIYDDLLKFYLQIFTDTLKKIGFEGHYPTWIDLEKSLKQYRMIEIFLFTSFLPASILFFKTQIDPSEMLSSSEFRKNNVYLSNDEFIQELDVLLPKFERLGYFEQS